MTSGRQAGRQRSGRADTVRTAPEPAGRLCWSHLGEEEREERLRVRQAYEKAFWALKKQHGQEAGHGHAASGATSAGDRPAVPSRAEVSRSACLFGKRRLAAQATAVVTQGGQQHRWDRLQLVCRLSLRIHCGVDDAPIPHDGPSGPGALAAPPGPGRSPGTSYRGSQAAAHSDSATAAE